MDLMTEYIIKTFVTSYQCSKIFDLQPEKLGKLPGL